VSALSSTSSSFGTAAASAKFESHSNGIDESMKAQALAEEEAAMSQYKVLHHQQQALLIKHFLLNSFFSVKGGLADSSNESLLGIAAGIVGQHC
jgi:hypothetical protein